MTEHRFYHLTRSTLNEALPQLLEKTVARGWRALVRVASAERVESIAEGLWTFRADSFLPHGTRKDGHADEQPVWITDHDENPNKATVLFLADGADMADKSGFSLICDVFDGHDEAALAGARTRYRTARESGFEVSYWQQEEHGWSKK
jgi:DNA polymerase-3 subunit chi